MIRCETCGKRVDEGVLVIKKGLDISPVFVCVLCYEDILNTTFGKMVGAIIEKTKGGEN